MRILPPLNSIKAFEASARLGSFVDAAEELGVTSAAVSLQVKKAEEYFGKQLFMRQNNAIILTDAGHMLFQPVSQSLSNLSELTELMLENEVTAQFTVSTIQSISDKWVAPALAMSRIKYPDLGIKLVIEDDPVDLMHHRVDVRLTYGGQHYPKSDTKIIATDRVMPMTSPVFSKAHNNTIENVDDRELIHIDWGSAYASYPSWASWFGSAGMARVPDLRKGIRVAGTAVAAALAEQRGGVVLAPVGLTTKQIATGALVAMHTTSQALPFDFIAIQNPRIIEAGGSPLRVQFLGVFLDALIQVATSSLSNDA